jgi:hypothetical protein
MGKSDDNCDTLIQFMHPDGPSPSFHWPQKDDICQVGNGKHIESNTTTGNRDRMSAHPP